jgi:hypothetical protein
MSTLVTNPRGADAPKGDADDVDTVGTAVSGVAASRAKATAIALLAVVAPTALAVAVRALAGGAEVEAFGLDVSWPSEMPRLARGSAAVDLEAPRLLGGVGLALSWASIARICRERRPNTR